MIEDMSFDKWEFTTFLLFSEVSFSPMFSWVMIAFNFSTSPIHSYIKVIQTLLLASLTANFERWAIYLNVWVDLKHTEWGSVIFLQIEVMT